jgi:GT2 family glycosyltransferase
VPNLSVVIVAFKSRETIGKCVASLPADSEVFVIENLSGTDEIDASSLPPNVRHVRMESNVGFGRACNVGLTNASGKYALVLNPDAWADDPSDVHALVDFLETQPNVVAVGGRLLLPDGSVQLSCARELTLWGVFLEQTLLEKLLFGYWIDTSGALEPVKVPQVTGACFAMKRINGMFMAFDDRFFLYCEDTELMKRISKHGAIVHLPNAVFHHELGASSDKNRWFAVACYNRGKELYFHIHHGKAASMFCFLLNRSGALLRLAIWSVAAVVTVGTIRRFRENVATFAKVLFAPLDVYRTGDTP